MNRISSLDNLRCFLAAARALNFRRAARTMALTPTAFGQRLKQLEEQVSAVLFVRSTRSVTLTEAGLALIPLAEQCIAAAEACQTIGSPDLAHPATDLVLGTRHELGMSWVLPNRKKLMSRSPWLSIHLYFGSGPDLLLRLRTMEIDCAITSTSVLDPKLEAIQLHREDYVFVGQSKLLKKTPLLKLADASRHTFIDISSELPLFRYFRDAAAGREKVSFGRLSWLGNIAPIRQEVLEGGGVAVLPEYFVRADIASGKLSTVFPKERLLYDHFRLVFRGADPRKSIFQSIAEELSQSPLS